MANLASVYTLFYNILGRNHVSHGSCGTDQRGLQGSPCGGTVGVAIDPLLTTCGMTRPQGAVYLRTQDPKSQPPGFFLTTGGQVWACMLHSPGFFLTTL